MAAPAKRFDILAPSPIANGTGPHPRRTVNLTGQGAVPINFARPTSMYEQGPSTTKTPKNSPPIPVRSPLRPRPRAIVSSTQVLEDARNLVAQVDEMPLTHSRSYASLAGLLESLDLTDGTRPMSSEQLLPGRPDSPSIISSIDDDDASPGPSHPPPTMSKRTHALLELLTSERAYASDLALIRDIHIPLALGT